MQIPVHHQTVLVPSSSEDKRNTFKPGVLLDARPLRNQLLLRFLGRVL